MQQQQERQASEVVAHSAPAPSVAPPATVPTPPPPETDGFLTVLVTPKLTFSLPKQTSWQTAEDIGQASLREAFLSRFPLRFDADKLTFMCTTPSLSLQGRERLVYKICSTNGGDDERVLLQILCSLDKAYAAHYEKKFEEVRADMLSSTMTFQVVADEVRTAQQAAARHWEKEVRGMKEQLSMNQKRLFLLEREKEGLLKTVHTSDDVVVQLRRSVDALSSENHRMRSRQSDLESQVVALREAVATHLGGLAAGASPPTGESSAAVPGAFTSSAAAATAAATAASASVGTQTAEAEAPGESESEAAAAARLAVEKWQQAMGEWLRTGAELCGSAVADGIEAPASGARDGARDGALPIGVGIAGPEATPAATDASDDEPSSS